MTSQQAKEKASENFKKGFNCTQSVVSVFAEELGYDEQTLLKICQPFGGGICRTREICGTVSGMLFCLGMKLDGTAALVNRYFTHDVGAVDTVACVA